MGELQKMETINVPPPGGALQRDGLTETNATALAARERAMIETMTVMAVQRPRKWAEVERKLLEQCEIPNFAETARWSRIVGRKKNEETGKWEDEWGEGFSIRFAEAAAAALGHMYMSSDVAGESDQYRILRSIVVDIENNVVWVSPDVVTKTMERSELRKDQAAISQRMNSQGKVVYTVASDDASLRQKMNAALARTQRQNILKVLPQWIKESCEEQIEKTLKGQSKEAIIDRITRGFDKLGVTMVDIQDWLGHSLSKITDEELGHLRGCYTVVKEGETTWAEIVRARKSAPIDVPPEGTQEDANKAKAERMEKLTTEPVAEQASEEKIVEVDPALMDRAKRAPIPGPETTAAASDPDDAPKGGRGRKLF